MTLAFTKTSSTRQGIRNMNSRTNVKSSHSDNLVLTLWLSRLLGTAPVIFQHNRLGFSTRTSKPLFVYGILLSLLLHTSIVLGVLRDMKDGPRGVRMRSSWTRYAWSIELCILMPTVSVSAFGAFWRMDRTSAFLDIVSKITCEIESPRKVNKNSRAQFFAVLLYIVSQIALLFADCFEFSYDSIAEDRDYQVMYFYSCFYLEHLIVIMLQLEFMCVAMIVLSGLRTINKALEDIVFFIDLHGSTTSSIDVGLGTSYLPQQVKPVNTLIDRMSSFYQSTAPTPNTQSTAVSNAWKRLKSVCVSYASIRDVVAAVNDNYGLLLLLLIISFIFHITVTVLYFIDMWNSRKPRDMNITVQIIHAIIHFLSMLTVVEPAYMTEKEHECTQELTSKLFLRSPRSRQEFADLDNLFRQIKLDTVHYSPLNFCRISRSLIILILSSAASYVIIVLQFLNINGEYA